MVGGLLYLSWNCHTNIGSPDSPNLVSLVTHVNAQVYILSILYCYGSLIYQHRESTEDLKNQLYHERTEGRRKLIAEKKNKDGAGRDKNISQRWKDILPQISASNSHKYWKLYVNDLVPLVNINGYLLRHQSMSSLLYVDVLK